jgi:hypothetical protein
MALLACAEPPPEEVWVRDPSAPATLRIWLDEETGRNPTVGTWIDLYAERESGRWRRMRLADLEPGTRWLRRPPETVESNVESNIRWLVEPEGAAEFNLPDADDLFGRRVRFDAPGTYSVWAQSHTWGGDTVVSTPLTVTVRP